jgi:transcriptional regulator with XRE-family HTH domain
MLGDGESGSEVAVNSPISRWRFNGRMDDLDLAPDPPAPDDVRIADEFMVGLLRDVDRAEAASAPSWFIPPPYGWRHPVTGRRDLPDPALITFGQYLKRGRYFARMSQQQLADASGVEQSQISRAERALAPSLGMEYLIKLGKPLGRALPLGFCPHEHYCHWQPAPPPREEPPLVTERMAKLIASLSWDKEK